MLATRVALRLIATCMLTWTVVGPLSAQHTIAAPSGAELSFTEDGVREMLERSRALREILERDPRVLYYLGFSSAAEPTAPDSAYPWTAVRVQNDSVARVITPGNLREADRAYANYAVRTMRSLRSESPPSGCETAMEREVASVSAFVDGWIVARTLYGGPPFAPLDALAFARDERMLPAMLAELRDTRLGPCAGIWAERHPERIERFRSWYEERFPSMGENEQP